MRVNLTARAHDIILMNSPNEARPVPLAYHAVAAGFVAWCAWMATQRPDTYSAAMQEDRVIEWMSVFVFAAAGIAGLIRAVRQRRVFDALVALFFLFVAGEEMSWGQRLLGLTPPAYFLEHNTQQEMNVHNFANLFGSPKGPFTMVLVGYGILLPLAGVVSLGRRVLSRIGATPPPLAAIPWFVAAIVLFIWYPFRFTGEWTELLAGSAFLVSMGLPARALTVLAPVGLVLAMGLTMWSARGSSDPVRAACAAAEVNAIAGALTAQRLGSDNAHKRVWTLAEEGRVDTAMVRRQLDAVHCDDRSAPTRRRFAVDPWGTAYWIRVARGDTGAMVTAYSFGPNRRRDIDASARTVGDDIFVRTRLSSP